MVSGIENKRCLRYYKRNTVFSSIGLGLSFICLIAGVLVAAIAKLWGFFVLSGIGLLGMILTTFFLSWHSLRLQGALQIEKLIALIKQKDCHIVLELAMFLKSDQQGTLYLLKNILRVNALSDYELVDDVLLAKKSLNFSDEEIKKMSRHTNLGKIRYQQSSITCPHCHCQVDFANQICPYCNQIL